MSKNCAIDRVLFLLMHPVSAELAFAPLQPEVFADSRERLRLDVTSRDQPLLARNLNAGVPFALIIRRRLPTR